jgi:hypothetical protein
MPPIQRPPFPQGRLSQIWDYVVDKLVNHGVLQSSIATFQTWEGTVEDSQAITLEGMPALLITPGASSLSWTDEGRHGGTWDLNLELGMPVSDARWLMDGWEAIYGAIPWPYAHQTLVDLGCHQITLAGPTLGLVELANGQGVKASGTLRLHINVSDPA